MAPPRTYRDKAAGAEARELVVSPARQRVRPPPKASKAKDNPRAERNTKAKPPRQLHLAHNKKTKTCTAPECVRGRVMYGLGFFFRCAELAEYKTNTAYAPYMTTSNGFIPPHGGYENLLSFQKAKIVFDGTVIFCKRFLEKRDRTVDQMVQAARSENRILSRAVSPPAHQRRLRSSWLMWHERAWANFSRITTTFCAFAICDSGKRIAVRPLLFAG